MNATAPTDTHSIHTEQHSIHSDLSKIVARHASHLFQKPYAEHNLHAFKQMMSVWAEGGYPPLILDSGCGVGESTLHIAQAHPDCFVVGVDQSELRIQTQKTWWTGVWPENLLWVRADVVDFWRLLADELVQLGLSLYKHYVLYPNPYPKIGQLHKRWHGHAVFPTLLKLGGTLEARSNWDIYIQEFACAVTQLTDLKPEFVGQLVDIEPITPFERKYQARGETLWGARFVLNRTTSETLK